MRRKIRAILISPYFKTFLYRLVRAYSWTFRLTLENEEPWIEYMRGGGKIILCIWHQQFFVMLSYCEKFRSLDPGVIVSKNEDGELVAGVLEKIGWTPVRGSTSKGGGQALRVLVRKLRETRLAAHIMDGPTGPAGIVKNGVIHLAQLSGAAALPVDVSADRAWYVRSWDRFLIPKPFSRVTIRFGEMIRFDLTENEDEFERQRQYLESVMLPFLKR